MTAPQSDFPSDDLRGYFERPEVWTQVSQGLQRVALTIVGNERDAEDVVQGVWLEALRDPERRPSTGWMRRLVRYRALDVLRRKRRDPIALDCEVPEGPSVENPDSRWKIEAQREVLDAVQALKEPYLSTIVLRYFEGKGSREIAAQLSVPERTVKTRLTRAHAMLRTRLGERNQDQFGNWAPALLAFSGYAGPEVGSVSLPATGALLMKKKLLVAAVLAVFICVPFALQPGGAVPEGMVQPDPPDQELVGLVLRAEVETPSTRSRETVPVLNDTAPQDQASFEYAFPPASESESGSLGIRVRWSDGSPAEHLKIGIMPQDAADAFLMSRTVYTDSAGFATADRLTPGLATVFFHRLGSEEVEIIAGEYTQIEKEARPGATFTGQVLSPSGQPVGGAQIFVADSRGGDSLPEPSAIADGAGRYEVRSVYDRSYVSARASGFSPSIPIETGVSTGKAMELDLTLRGSPASLRGIARSPDGLPVNGAKIRIDLAAVDGATQGTSGFPLSFVLQTDERGRFETDQIGAGVITITARTATWQPWVGSFQLEAEESREITIQFDRGVELSGVVREEDGDPIPNTRLFSGQIAGPASYRVRTDESGRYRIHGLPPGVSDIKVFHEEFEELNDQLVLRSDATNQVDFILHRLQSVSGVVVDKADAPLSRWYVAVEAEKGLWAAGSWTDTDGSFNIVGIPDGTTDLIVTTEDYWESAARWSVPSVIPAPGPLRIVVPDSVVPRSSIRMKLQVDGKPAPVETRIRLRSTSPLTHRDVHPSADGSLVLARLASREFRLEVALEGYASLNRTFHLGVSEDLDLGTLVLQQGGRVRVQVEGLLYDSAATCHIVDVRGQSLQSFALQGGEGLSPPLPTGAVNLRYNPTEGATQFAAVDVASGETSLALVMTQPGTSRTIQIARQGGGPVRFRTKANVTDSRGFTHFYTEDLRRLQQVGGATTIELQGLELGSYRLWIQDPGGDVHESWFNVSSLEDGVVQAQLDWQ